MHAPVIAVDVCVGRRGVAMLRAAGYDVIEAQHAESDREWFARALAAGAVLVVSGDSDIEIAAYDADVRFLHVQRGEDGCDIARRVIAMRYESPQADKGAG